MSQDVQDEALILVMHDSSKSRVRRECAVDVVPVVAVAAILCTVVNSDDVPASFQPGYESTEHTIKVFGAEVVEDLTGNDQVIVTVGKIARKDRMLDLDVAELGDGAVGLGDGAGSAIYGKQLVASGSQQPGELADGAAEFEAVVVPLPGQ